jgi:hypothetical protein
MKLKYYKRPFQPFRFVKWTHLSLQKEELNTVNMSDVNAHVSFISGHDTEIIMTTKQLFPFSSNTASGKTN